MPKKHHLFLLIKSLTKAEKRHFKLSTATAGQDKKYIHLFDFIDKQEAYDEGVIRRRFEKEAFVKQLHVAKNYLNKLILKSLRNFHTGMSKEAELNELLRDAEILLRRELFDQCEHVLAKAQRLACEYEKHQYLVAIYEWQRKLLLSRAGGGQRQSTLNELITLQRESLRKLITLNDYWDLTVNIFDHLEPQTSKQSKKSDLHPLLKNIKSADTLQSRILYYHALQTNYFLSGQLSKAEKCASDLIHMLENQPEHIRDNPASYITALNNKIGVCLQAGKLDAIPELLHNIRGIPQTYDLKPNSRMAVKAVLQTYNVELEMYRDKGEVEKGVALIDKIEILLAEYGERAPDEYKILLQYQCAYLLFMKKNFKASLIWLNKILSKRGSPIREDIQSFAQLLNLIIHFELENISLLKYAVDSCRRLLKRKRELHDFEKVLLRFFSKISLAHEEKYPDLFQQLKQTLFANTEQHVAANALDYLDFNRWIEEKLGEMH